MIKYRTRFCEIEIVPVECEKETDTHVWVNWDVNCTSAYNKRGNYQCFHDTWQEAYDYLLYTNTKHSEELLRDYNKVLGKLEKIKAMKEGKDKFSHLMSKIDEAVDMINNSNKPFWINLPRSR